jgi:hypothetical protein
MSDERQKFTVSIACSNCGTLGAVDWEEASGTNRPRGPERKLVAIHGEFHQEAGRTHSGDPMIVCNLCDQIQAD